MAHVSDGRRDRDRAPWEDHLAYLGGLADLLTAPVAGHLLVMGDFNQRLSGRWGSAEAHDALLRTFAGLEFATGGLSPGLEEELIDHIAHSPSLTAGALTAISRLQDGVELSDHNGVVVDLVPS